MAETYALKALAADAQAGHADAMYRLSALLIQMEGEEARALDWLRKAASAGHGGARYSLAVLTESGQHLEAKPERAVTLLETVSAEIPQARQMLAVMRALGYSAQAPDWEAAVRLTIEAAGKGDALALRDVGMLLALAGEDASFYLAFLRAAAEAGDVLSAAQCLHHVLAGFNGLPPSVQQTYLEQVMAAGHPLAATWQAGLAAKADVEGLTGTAVVDKAAMVADLLANPDSLSQRIAAAVGRGRTPMAEKSEAVAGLSALRGFVPRSLCVHAVGLAHPYMEPTDDAHVFAAKLATARTDLALAALSVRVRRSLGYSVLAVPHVYCILPQAAGWPDMGEVGSQASLIARLSDVPEGLGLMDVTSGLAVDMLAGDAVMVHHGGLEQDRLTGLAVDKGLTTAFWQMGWRALT